REGGLLRSRAQRPPPRPARGRADGVRADRARGHGRPGPRSRRRPRDRPDARDRRVGPARSPGRATGPAGPGRRPSPLLRSAPRARSPARRRAARPSRAPALPLTAALSILFHTGCAWVVVVCDNYAQLPRRQIAPRRQAGSLEIDLLRPLTDDL